MELGEGFKLCSGLCIGARAGSEKNQLLLSFDVGTVQIYDAISHSCVGSWQLPSDQCLCSPAIYHSSSDHYWAVRSNRGKHTSNATVELLSWRRGDHDMLAGKSVPLPHSKIFALLDTPTTDSPAVVYSSGGVAVGGANLRPPEAERGRKLTNPRVVSADTVCCGGVEYVCVVSVASNGTNDAAIRLWALSEGQATLLSSSDLTNTTGVVDCCVCATSLITIGGDGCLCRWSIEDALHSHVLIPTQRFTPTPSPIKSVHLASVSCDYFVLVGVASEGTQLSIWDVSYLTNQASCLLSDPPSTLHHVICSVCGYTVVCGGESVTLVSMRERSNCGTLAAALGRGQSSTTDQRLCGTGITVVQDDAQTQRDVLNILIDRNKTPTLELFMQEFLVVPELDYSLVVHRLLGETEFWARDALLHLLQENIFPSSLVGELLEVALGKKDWYLVSVVLGECRDCVPERTTVKLLEAALKLPCSVSLGDGGGLSREQLLVSLLSIPGNDALFHLPLSQLPFNSVIMLLEWLCHRVDMSQLLTTPTQLSSSHHLSYDCVIDWISVLVDVHFTELTLQPQARHLLTKLHGTVFKQMKCLDHLSIVGAAQYMTKATPTKSSENWLYKIEKLPINI